MPFQAEVGSSSSRATTYRDLLTKVVALATSQHVATVAVNAAGSGYVTGDVVKLTHASGYLPAYFEVTAAAGAITSLRIRSNGAFAGRAASATVSAGGTGYAVGDILEIQGGTQREKGKFRVATLSGSAVATVTLFETGGAYTATPSNPASTTAIGPTAAAGTGATLTVTYQTIVGTTGLSLTTVTGVGTGGTVDITLAQSGWTADRNKNNLTFNSLTDEKEVVLKGDAAGKTNKPYIGFQSATATSGLNTRYFLALFGMTSHNPGTALSLQTGISPGTPSSFADGGAYIPCDENQLQNMDFWCSVNDQRIVLVHNTNSSAVNTDDGEYHHAYAGFMNSFAVESEDPYPMLIGASSRIANIDPSASSENITGLSECHTSTGTAPVFFYRSETSTWLGLKNGEGLVTAEQEVTHAMAPIAKLVLIDGSSNAADLIVTVSSATAQLYSGIGSVIRASASRRLFPIPGSTPTHWPIPLTVLSRPGLTQANRTLDTVRGQLDGVFWVSATNSAGSTITNFSEDYVTIGSARYRVFHTHVQRQLYHYICVKETV